MVPVDERILSHLRRGTLEYCVLALLRSGPHYGLDIARTLTSGGILMSGEGTLYPLLSRLRKAGLVVTKWQESTSGPPRRYYSLTAEGDKSFEAFNETWTAFRNAVDSALSASHGRSAEPGAESLVNEFRVTPAQDPLSNGES